MLTFRYDAQGDVPYIDVRAPYAEQESDEVCDGMVARSNPRTGAIENVEILFFVARMLHDAKLDVPVSVVMKPEGSG